MSLPIRVPSRLGATLLITAAGAWAQTTQSRPAAAPTFELTFTKSVQEEPFSGRVFVIVSRRMHTDPVDLVEWFGSEPVYAWDVRDWRPGKKLRLSADEAIQYPTPLAELPPRTYRVRAVLGRNDWAQHPIDAPGNGISDLAVLTHPTERPATVRLRINERIPEFTPAELEGVKYIQVRSPLLSEFYRREVLLRAQIVLPAGYAEDGARRYPTVYMIPGFDGRLESATPEPMSILLGAAGLDALVVWLEASCPLGHHVFADSDNNGPWGRAFVEEFVPEFERQYRVQAEPAARLLTGHSSGGWSSLWVQITHPDCFGGVWATSPDPVDFHDFLGVNIYEPPASVYEDSAGQPRRLTRAGWFGEITWRELDDLERVFGRGGQLGSFEAVFSPRGADGRPAPLWDRKTGALDPAVARAWRRYDICQLLEKDWARLGPQLSGKLHIYCGDQDDFFLEQAVHWLRDTLKKLGSDGLVEIVPGATHALPSTVFERIAGEMADRLRKP